MTKTSHNFVGALDSSSAYLLFLSRPLFVSILFNMWLMLNGYDNCFGGFHGLKLQYDIKKDFTEIEEERKSEIETFCSMIRHFHLPYLNCFSIFYCLYFFFLLKNMITTRNCRRICLNIFIALFKHRSL
jgi:hypothetical protein